MKTVKLGVFAYISLEGPNLIDHNLPKSWTTVSKQHERKPHISHQGGATAGLVKEMAHTFVNQRWDYAQQFWIKSIVRFLAWLEQTEPDGLSAHCQQQPPIQLQNSVMLRSLLARSHLMVVTWAGQDRGEPTIGEFRGTGAINQKDLAVGFLFRLNIHKWPQFISYYQVLPKYEP